MQNVPWHEEVMLLKLLTLPTNSDSFDQAGFNNLDCCPLNLTVFVRLSCYIYIDLVSVENLHVLRPSSSTESFFVLFNGLSFSPQVIGFVQKLTDLLPDYEIACEHEHSNCLLICHKKVRVENVTFFDFSSQTGRTYRANKSLSLYWKWQIWQRQYTRWARL